nr:protein PXR1-like [Ipomoea trifida]
MPFVPSLSQTRSRLRPTPTYESDEGFASTLTLYSSPPLPLLTNPKAILVSAFAPTDEFDDCTCLRLRPSLQQRRCCWLRRQNLQAKEGREGSPGDVSEEDTTSMKVEKENVVGDGVIAGKVTNLRRYRESVLGDVSGKATYDSVIARKVLGRKWKQARTHMSSAVQNEIEKRQKREEREKRKKKNILKSGTKFQKITNPKTLKKIAKSAKHKKLLKVVYDDLLKAGNK